MNTYQMAALSKPVQTQAELQAAWDKPRIYNHDLKRKWLVNLVVAKGNERFEWHATVRLIHAKKGTSKPVLSWTQEEIARANMILTNELVGVGRIVSTEEKSGKYYRMLFRPLTEDEEGMISDPTKIGN